MIHFNYGYLKSSNYNQIFGNIQNSGEEGGCGNSLAYFSDRKISIKPIRLKNWSASPNINIMTVVDLPNPLEKKDNSLG